VTIGFVGFVRDWHGLDAVISGLAAHRGDPPIRLVVVGDGPARRTLEHQAEALGAKDLVRFTGLRGRESIAEVIRGFDIALQPRAVAYASPLKLFEYMACGRAIVAPDQPNIREILKDGETAILFDPDDEDGLWQGVRQLAGDPKLREKLGQAARNVLEAHGYTWESNAARIVAAAAGELGRRGATQTGRPLAIAPCRQDRDERGHGWGRGPRLAGSVQRVFRTRRRRGYCGDGISCSAHVRAERLSVPEDIVFREEPLPPIAVLERDWKRLETLSRPSFFTSWHWIGTLLTAVPAARRPRLLRGVLCGETVALALLGANSLRRRHGLVRSRSLYINETGDPSFDSLTIEHNGLLAAAPHEKTALDGLLAWFAGKGAEADELYLSGSLDRVSEKSVEGAGLGRYETAVPSYSLDLTCLAASGGELSPVLSANARQQLRRAMRYFERFGALQLRSAANFAEAQEFFSGMKELHAASWERRGKAHAFTNAFFERFHRLLIERSFAAGAIELSRASAGNHTLGYLYNFRLGGRIYAYQSGFRYDDRQARPGAVVHALAILDAHRSGAAVYDFLAGRNRLKESFSTRRENMLWQILQQPRLSFRLEHLGRRLKHAVLAERR
jgi:CelD/BcsL family acetyltransferase involved in cellulose biosynthesis